MVVLCNSEDLNGRNPRTLGDWVKNFRLKKIQMKRKLRSSGGELRVCAILSTALMTAELELRRKQQERFQKWLEFQAKIKNNELLQTGCELESHHNNSQQDNTSGVVNICKQTEEINNLWKCELSELDNFMRSISSNNYSRNSTNDSNICGGGVCCRESIRQPLTSPQPVQVKS